MVVLFPFFIFFISFSIYLLSVFPSIYWRDASEFQAIGFLLDIAHPAGSPLYSIIAKLFTFIPLGSISFKVTLVSCFFGALISVLLYWVILSVFELLSKALLDRSRPTFEPIIALFCALVFSFSNALWENSNVPEVYTLQNFFTIFFMLILLKLEGLRLHLPERGQGRILPLLMTLLFLLGLSLGAHAILVLYVPLLVLWIYFFYLRSSPFNPLKIMSLSLFFFLLAFSVYLHLPIRSVQNPYYDWGNPETFQTLMTHASDRKDAAYHFSVSKSVLPSQMSMYLGFYPDNFSYLGIVFSFIGFFYLLFKKKTRLLLIFTLFFFPPFLFFIRYWGETSAFIPNFLIFCILMSIGFFVFSIQIKKLIAHKHLRRSYVSILLVFIALQFVLLFSDHLEENKGSDYWMPRDVTRNMINDLPPNAIIISSLTWFMLSYLQQAEGYRPDVSILSLTSFIAPDFFSKLEASKFPNIVIPEESLEELGSAFLSENIVHHPIYWETAGWRNQLVEQYLVPDGLFFQISENPPEMDQKVIRAHFEKLGRQLPFKDISENREERILFSILISGMGEFFMKREKYQAARDHYKLVTTLVPNNSNYINGLGAAYGYLQKNELAEKSFLQAIALNPQDYIPYLNLAEIYYSNQDVKKAMLYFERVLERYPNHQQSLFALGKINMKKGNKKEGLNYFKKLLEFYPDDEAVRAQVGLLIGEIKS